MKNPYCQKFCHFQIFFAKKLPQIRQTVVENWGLKGPTLFFVCLLYSPLKNADFISQAYRWNALTVDDVTSTLSDLWPWFPRVPCLPQGPLSSPGPLCLSSVSPPGCIVSLCQGFVWSRNPGVLEKMTATGNESNDLSLSESTDFEDNDKTSDSNSVLQSSAEPQQLGSSQIDQNLSKSCFSSDESFIRLGWWW